MFWEEVESLTLGAWKHPPCELGAGKCSIPRFWHLETWNMTLNCWSWTSYIVGRTSNPVPGKGVDSQSWCCPGGRSPQWVRGKLLYSLLFQEGRLILFQLVCVPVQWTTIQMILASWSRWKMSEFVLVFFIVWFLFKTWDVHKGHHVSVQGGPMLYMLPKVNNLSIVSSGLQRYASDSWG